MFTNKDSNANHFLLLIKVGQIPFTYSFLYSVPQAIALFNAAQHEEAMFLVNELAAACPTVDLLGCRVVEVSVMRHARTLTLIFAFALQAYLRVQLGIDAFNGARHDEAADHFTAAVNSTAFSSKFIYQIYEDLTVVRQYCPYIMLFLTDCFVQLFGWDLESLLLTTHQKRCQAFLSAGKSDEALEAHKHMMDVIDGPAKASCLDWSNGMSSLTSLAAIILTRISFRIQGTMQRVGCAR
jgi:hypothetical protein